MRVTPPGRRSTARRTPEGFEVSIPAKRHILQLGFLTVWLTGWGAGGLFATWQVLFNTKSPADLILLVWLLFWAVFGSFAVYTWLWMVTGREVLALRPNALVVKRVVLAGLGRSKEYDLRHTKNLRLGAQTWNAFAWDRGMQFWGIGGGPIAFDYGSQTIRVGAGLDEAEAREVVRELKAEYPFADDPAA
jgi:hypothetical protein